MGRNKKKYLGYPTIFRTKCINPEETVYLRNKWYDVIQEDSTNYLIKFNSGAVNWYSKDRFEGIYYPKDPTFI